MSRAQFHAGLLTLAALLYTGCAGPVLLRARGSNSPADRSEAGPSKSGVRAGTSAAKPLASQASARPSELPTEKPAARGSAEDTTDARIREALESLRGSNPEQYAALRSILETPPADLPGPYQRYLRDQFAAVLLQRAAEKKPASEVQSGQTGANPPAAQPASEEPQRPKGSGSVVPAAAYSAAKPAEERERPQSLPVEASVSDRRDAAPQPGAQGERPVLPPAAGREEQQPAPDSPTETRERAWQEHLSAAIDTLEKELIRPGHDEAEAARLTACLRLLCVVANRREQAVGQIDGLGEDERDYWKHQLYGLLVSLDAEGVNAASRRAALALRELRQATDHLSNISALDVRGLAFCSRVDSYGRYVEYKSYVFAPGQEVLLYVEVDNFAAERKGEQYETELQGEYEIVDAQGQRVTNAVLPCDQQLCNNRRRDYFIAYRLYMPKQIAPGAYTLRLTIEDVKGKKSNQGSLDFRIK